MVDLERLLALLARVTSRLAVLDGYATVDRDALLADPVRLGHLKYTFQTAIEATIDSAHHVVADQGLGVPPTNAATFGVLAEHGLLDRELATSMAGAVGFRNVLVHGYAEVDDGLVVDHLANLRALRGFVAAMSALL